MSSRGYAAAGMLTLFHKACNVFANPSKIQNPKSNIQNPNSKFNDRHSITGEDKSTRNARDPMKENRKSAIIRVPYVVRSTPYKINCGLGGRVTSHYVRREPLHASQLVTAIIITPSSSFVCATTVSACIHSLGRFQTEGGRKTAIEVLSAFASFSGTGHESGGLLHSA